MRDLITVIDSLCQVAPDVEPEFKWLRRHISYTPPEAMQENWWRAMEILKEHASRHPEHPHLEELRKIFVDEKP